MKIVSLTPGTGHFHCGSCLRDHALVKALRAMGHDATMVPMYLPLMTDEPVDAADDHPIQFGGVNVYLQQKSKLFRNAPRAIDGLFNQPWMLRHAASRSGMTSARELAELTISMLAGEDGFQKKELDKLIDYLERNGKPDVVSLSNGLLVGLICSIHQRLGAKVIVSLQGEDAFLDALPDGDRQRAWQLFSECAAEADAIVGPSAYYSRAMQSRLEHDDSRYHTVHNGIALEGYDPSGHDMRMDEANPPVIGYLARMCHGKGLHTLVDAFILLRAMPGCEHALLHIAGAKTAADDVYVDEHAANLPLRGWNGQRYGSQTYRFNASSS